MDLKQRLRRVQRTIDTIDEFAIDVVTRGTTWAAPLVPAFMVYHGAQSIPGIGRSQALVTAIVIELLGLSVTSNLLNVTEFNRHAVRDSDKLPIGWHVVMVVGYVGIVMAIVIGLKVTEAAKWLAIVSLSILSLLSAASFVMRRQHAARMDEMAHVAQDTAEDVELDRQIAREMKLAQHERRLADIRTVTPAAIDADAVTEAPVDNGAVTKAPGPKAADNDTPTLTVTDRRDKMLRVIASSFDTPSDIDYDRLAAEFDISARTARRDIAALVDAGRLSLNGAVHMVDTP